MKIIRFLNHSNLFVALGAACLTTETFLVNDFLVNPFAIAQSFFLVWCAYLFLKKEEGFRLMIYVAVTGLILTGYFNTHWLLIVPALLVAFYNTKWLNEIGWKKNFSLRSIGWFKPVVIALCWTLVTSAIPLLNSDSVFGTKEMLFSLQHFLFILSLAIAGDIRDADIDRGMIRTLPTFIQKARMKSIAVLLMLLSFFVDAMQAETFLLSEIIFVLTTIFVFIYVFRRKPNWHLHTFLLDALLPARLIIFLLFMK